MVVDSEDQRQIYALNATEPEECRSEAKRQWAKPRRLNSTHP